MKCEIFAAVPSLAFNLQGGDDMLTVDNINGPPAPAGGLSFNAGGLREGCRLD